MRNITPILMISAAFLLSSEMPKKDKVPPPAEIKVDHEKERLIIEAACYKNESNKARHDFTIFVYGWINEHEKFNR